jgi:hypothetical protein
MRREMATHLEEVAHRYYAGDVAVVDEFLQLYCFGEEARKAVVNQANATRPAGDGGSSTP